jgi:hypothetical protein
MFILPSLIAMLFLSLCRSEFLTSTIFPLSEELLLAFLEAGLLETNPFSFYLSEKVYFLFTLEG